MAEPHMRSPLGRAVGLGSAKEGVRHWWAQRVTAVALIPLSLWFVIAVIRLVGASRDDFGEWLGHPVPAVLMILLLIAIFYHIALGLQVVIEDYVHGEGGKLAALLAMRAACVVLVVTGVFSVLRIAFGG
jgi:succinate dehydrogenase / fumarate reductase membrane anchor subunit